MEIRGSDPDIKDDLLKVLPEDTYEVLMDGKSYAGPDFSGCGSASAGPEGNGRGR